MRFCLLSCLAISLSFSSLACSSDEGEENGAGDGDQTSGDGDSSGDGEPGADEDATGDGDGDGTGGDGETGGDGDGGIEGAGPGSSDTFEEQDGLVAVEAEHFSSYDGKGAPRDYYLTTSDHEPGITPDPDPNHSEGASGTGYLETLPDTRVTHDDDIKEGESIFNKAGTGPTLSYTVNFNTPGTYYVWVRAYSTGGEDNGIHVGLNGDFPESGQKLQFCSGKNQWTWSSAKRDSGGSACGVPNTITIEVPSAGEHTVQFSMREDGFEFDKWVMTQDEAFEPEGAGPDEVKR